MGSETREEEERMVVERLEHVALVSSRSITHLALRIIDEAVLREREECAVLADREAAKYECPAPNSPHAAAFQERWFIALELGRRIRSRTPVREKEGG